MSEAPEIKDEPYSPTVGERQMAQSINFLIGAMLRGELAGIGLCAITWDGQPSTFYLNKAKESVLRQPMEELRVMYETHRKFHKLDNTPVNNRSFRRH